MAEPGQTIGAYRVLRKLGEGGMGEVFEAVHDAIERHVAIKVLHPEYAQRQEFVTRFFNEARAVNRIDHPGLVQVSDFGQLPDKSAYIVMEFLKGDSLGTRLKQRSGPLELSQVLNLGCQLAESLAAAHEKGIIHRDLKPDNVMVVADSQMPGGERTKLLDFGIAKLTEEGGPVEVKTRTNSMMGTIYYMSPEQCRGAGKVDDRADVYSFGVMMYEMLSGERPFTGEGHGEIVVKQMMEEPAPLTSKAPTVPEPVATLVHQMLIKDKARRPSMAEVAAQLDAMRELAPAPMRRRSSTGMPVVPLTSTPTRPTGPHQTTSTVAGQSGMLYISKRSGRLLAIGAVVVAACAVLGLRFFGSSSPRPPPPPPVAIATSPPVTPPAPKPVEPKPEVKPTANLDNATLETPGDVGGRKKGKAGKGRKTAAAPLGGKPTGTTPSEPKATEPKKVPPSKRVIEE